MFRPLPVLGNEQMGGSPLPFQTYSPLEEERWRDGVKSSQNSWYHKFFDQNTQNISSFCEHVPKNVIDNLHIY